MLTDLVKAKRLFGELSVGIITAYNELEKQFEVRILPLNRTIKAKIPSWMQNEIEIPPNSLEITLPERTLTTSGGDTVIIPELTITFPDADPETGKGVLIPRFDFEVFVGRYCVVAYPRGEPVFVGVL